MGIEQARAQIHILSASLSFGQDLLVLVGYDFFPLVKRLLTYLPGDVALNT